MKIAILGAMEEEITLIKAKINKCETKIISHLSVFTGTIGTHTVFLVECGIGKSASAAATAILIHAFTPDAVINTGSAGGFDPELNIGDVVIGTQLLHHDVDLTTFGYKLGQSAQMPEYYESDAILIDVAKQAAANIPSVKIKTGLICSGDSFVGSDEAVAVITRNFPEMAAVEMEGAAIAQVCFMMNTSFVVIRSLSDIAGKTSTMSFDAYLEIAAKNSAKLVLNMLERL